MSRNKKRFHYPGWEVFFAYLHLWNIFILPKLQVSSLLGLSFIFIVAFSSWFGKLLLVEGTSNFSKEIIKNSGFEIPPAHLQTHNRGFSEPRHFLLFLAKTCTFFNHKDQSYTSQHDPNKKMSDGSLTRNPGTAHLKIQVEHSFDLVPLSIPASCYYIPWRAAVTEVWTPGSLVA